MLQVQLTMTHSFMNWNLSQDFRNCICKTLQSLPSHLHFPKNGSQQRFASHLHGTQVPCKTSGSDLTHVGGYAWVAGKCDDTWTSVSAGISGCILKPCPPLGYCTCSVSPDTAALGSSLESQSRGDNADSTWHQLFSSSVGFAWLVPKTRDPCWVKI